MRDKNIKKQHSAQALNNDDMESVSGGYHFDSDDPYAQCVYNHIYVSQEEGDYLKSKGIDPAKVNCSNLSEKRLVEDILKAGGFEHKSPW